MTPVAQVPAGVFFSSAVLGDEVPLFCTGEQGFPPAAVGKGA